jgi:iron complex outermembrane receptor protein
LTLSSSNNPATVDGLINVRPGNHLPLVPQHRLKTGAEYPILRRPGSSAPI